jgi:hypothetical protein
MPWAFSAGVNVLNPAKVVAYTKKRKGQVESATMMVEGRTKPVVFYPYSGTYWEISFEVDTMTQAERNSLEGILNDITNNVSVTSAMGDTWAMRLQGGYELDQVRAVPIAGETTPLRHWFHYTFTMVEVA